MRINFFVYMNINHISAKKSITTNVKHLSSLQDKVNSKSSTESTVKQIVTVIVNLT